MRYVAYKHVTNQIDNNFQSGACNLHSWAGEYSCCFTSDFRNNKCMWDKPQVRRKNEDCQEVSKN